MPLIRCKPYTVTISLIATEEGAGGAFHPNKSLYPPILGDSKFVKLLKIVRTFNLKINDASMSKIDKKL